MGYVQGELGKKIEELMDESFINCIWHRKEELLCGMIVWVERIF